MLHIWPRRPTICKPTTGPNGLLKQSTAAFNTTSPSNKATVIWMCSPSHTNTTSRAIDWRTRRPIVWFYTVIYPDLQCCTEHRLPWTLPQHHIHLRCAVKTKLTLKRFKPKSTRTCGRARHDPNSNTTTKYARHLDSKLVTMSSGINRHWRQLWNPPQSTWNLR